MRDCPVILFDVMDTLVYNPYNREIPAFFGISPSELLAAKDPVVWPLFELGKIDEAEYLARYFRDQRSFDHVGFLSAVADAYRWVDGAETLLDRLHRAGYEMHAFSNYPIWYRTIESRLQLSRYLQWTFVSCLTGIRKPAEEAFRRAARALNRPPSACLFIDDSVDNCRTAQAVGMPTIQFVSTDDLERRLRSLGIPGGPLP